MAVLEWVNLPDFMAQLRAIGEAGIAAAPAAAMAGVQVIDKHIKLNIGKQGLIDTGNYRNSWQVVLLSAGKNGAAAATGTSVEYGPIHEFGGVIKPKNAHFLAIPVGDLQGSPRDYDLNLATTRNGQYLLVDQTGKVQYLLRSAVTIPARPHVRPALEENIPEVEAVMIGAIKQVIQAASR